jgi:hypothetical protein
MTEILKDGARIGSRVPHQAQPIVLAKQERDWSVFLFGDGSGKDARTQLEPVIGERTDS